MALDEEINEVYDSNSSYSSDDDNNIDDLYQELYESLVRAKKDLNKKIVENNLLIEKLKSCEKENHDLNLLVEQLLTQNKPCAECKILKDKNYELTKSLQNFTNNRNNLDLILENQQNFQSEKGLGSVNERNNKRKLKGSLRTITKRHFGFINCFYCNQRGHHIRDYFYRNGTYVLRPNEKLVWLPKVTSSKLHSSLRTNIVGPKTIWVPSSKE